MFNTNTRVLTVVGVLAVAVLLSPTFGFAQGCQSCAAPVVAAPAYVSYMPQTYAYMPTPIYRAVYRPTVVTAYQPVYQTAYAPVYQTAYYAPATTYAYTTYRPLFGWNYQTRLVPYTTYQPVYSPAPVVAYSPCTSCVNYAPVDACSSGCNTCGTVTYGATSGCSSCAAPAASATVVTPPPYTGNGQAAPQGGTSAPPTTFDQKTETKTEKPAVETPKPIPQTETRLNSLPAPVLPDPRDRTAARPVTTASRTVMVASPVKPVVRDADGWGPASE